MSRGDSVVPQQPDVADDVLSDEALNDIVGGVGSAVGGTGAGDAPALLIQNIGGGGGTGGPT